MSVTGPLYGYYPNAVKTFLVVKSDLYDEAAEVFRDTNVKITCVGHRYLGGALGTPTFVIEAMKEKVSEWVTEIEELSRIGHTQPHAAYAALTHGIIGR